MSTIVDNCKAHTSEGDVYFDKGQGEYRFANGLNTKSATGCPNWKPTKGRRGPDDSFRIVTGNDLSFRIICAAACQMCNLQEGESGSGVIYQASLRLFQMGYPEQATTLNPDGLGGDPGLDSGDDGND